MAFTSSFTFTHPITIADDPEFDVTPSATVAISSAIADGASPGDLVKTNGGTLLLSAVNSYTGTATVQAGTLRMGVANALSTATAVTVDAGALFDLASFSQSIGSLAGAGSVTLGSATLTTGNDGTSTSYAGSIGGSGGLTKIGSGTFTLSGTSSYSGPTAVSGGSLDVEGSIANSLVAVANGGRLVGAGTVGSLLVAGGGILAPGAITPFTTLNVSGNATFASGAIFQVAVNPAGQPTGSPWRGLPPCRAERCRSRPPLAAIRKQAASPS